MLDVVIVSGLVLFFSMVGKKAEDINISAPMGMCMCIVYWYSMVYW